MLLMLTVDLGFGILGSRTIARGEEPTESIVTRVVGAQLNLALGICPLLFAVTWMLPMDPVLSGLLRGLGVSLLGVPFLLNWVFQGRNEMVWHAVPLALRQALFLAGTIALVRGPDDLWLLPAAEIGAVAGAGVLFVALYRRLGHRLRVDLRAGWDGPLFESSLPIGVSALIWAARMYVPVLVVLAVLGPDPAGLFESGHRLIMTLLALLNVYFTNVFPAMSATSHTSVRAFDSLSRRTLWTSVVGMAALGIVTIVLAPQLLRLVFGTRYVTADSVTALGVLACLAPVQAWRRTGRLSLIVLERQRTDLWCSILGLGLLLALLWPMARVGGIVGAAWAMVMSELAGAVLTWTAVRSEMLGLKAGAPGVV
jgi:O-antigen/teichoic acid export membrane protein